ncbi:MAG: TerB family tellurite resistance protein [Vicinamibacterales bacterium]
MPRPLKQTGRRSASAGTSPLLGRTLSVDQALIALLIGAMAANDHVAPDEAERAHHLIWFTRRFRNRSAARVGKLIADMRDLLDTSDASAVVRRAARAVPPPLRLSAFSLLTDLLLADGRLDARERRFLEQVGGDMRLDARRIEQVVEVIRQKNRL